MGMSPTANLFYGFDLGEMVDDDYESTAPSWWDEADGEWEDELARRLGWVEVPFPSDRPARDQTLAHTENEKVLADYRATSHLYREWSASRDRRAELLRGMPVEMASYGHCDGDSVWAIRVTASVQTVHGYDCAEVKPLTVAPEWREQLQHFAALLEFELPDGVEPGWHMSVYYG